MENILPKEISDIFAPTEEICKKYPADEWIIVITLSKTE